MFSEASLAVKSKLKEETNYPPPLQIPGTQDTNQAQTNRCRKEKFEATKNVFFCSQNKGINGLRKGGLTGRQDCLYVIVRIRENNSRYLYDVKHE